MTAHAQMRRMLDELMGTSRDGENIREKHHFTSHRVCKSFLLNCCPHDVLSATRCDLGQCPKIHNVALRADYETAAKTKDYNFHEEVVEQLRAFIAESDRRAQIAKRRLAQTQEVLTAEEADRLNKIHKVVTQIGEALAKAEQLGAEGKVEETLKMMETVEELKKEKFAAEEEYRIAVPSSIAQQQKLRVCEVCGSYLGLQDNDRRLADHFNGRLHLGFMTIREKAKELEQYLEDKEISKILHKQFKNSEESKSPKQRERSKSPTSRHKHSHKSRHRSRSPIDEKQSKEHQSSHRKSHSSYRHRSSSSSSSERDSSSSKADRKLSPSSPRSDSK